MNTPKFFVFTLLISLFISCSKDDDGESFEAPFEMELSLRTDALYKGTQFEFFAHEMNIDWGDNTQPYYYNGDDNTWKMTAVSHQYELAGPAEYTVKVYGKGLKQFHIMEDPANPDAQGGIVKSVDIKSCPGLVDLALCGVEDMSAFDVGKLPVLKSMHLKKTRFSSVDYRQYGLESIGLWDNNLLSDIKLPAGLRELTIRSCDLLTAENIELDKFKNLNSLNLLNNKWVKVDVRENTSLKYLLIINSNAETVDLSKHATLESVWIEDANLSKIISPATFSELREICMADNQLDKESLDLLFTTLPTRTNPGDRYQVIVSNNPGYAQCNRQLAKEKGWEVK